MHLSQVSQGYPQSVSVEDLFCNLQEGIAKRIMGYAQKYGGEA